MFDCLLDFSLYDTVVVLTAAFALLGRMRTSLNAPTARKRDSRLMEGRENILTISLSHLSYKLCQQTLYMQRRCAIRQIISTSLVSSRTFLMAPIINPYSTLLSPPVRLILFSTFPINGTLPLAFRQTVSLHSRSAIRLVGPSFFSTTISLLKYASRRNTAFTLPQFRVQKSCGIGTRLVGHSFKNWFN